jgi:hypothetical protein
VPGTSESIDDGTIDALVAEELQRV